MKRTPKNNAQRLAEYERLRADVAEARIRARLGLSDAPQRAATMKVGKVQRIGVKRRWSTLGGSQ